jgi:hypothetical protein
MLVLPAVNPPGYRYVPRTSLGTPGIAPCELDTYSTGYAKQLTCTSCPGGFKTKPDNLAGSQTGPDVCSEFSTSATDAKAIC